MGYRDIILVEYWYAMYKWEVEICGSGKHIFVYEDEFTLNWCIDRQFPFRNIGRGIDCSRRFWRIRLRTPPKTRWFDDKGGRNRHRVPCKHGRLCRILPQSFRRLLAWRNFSRSDSIWLHMRHEVAEGAVTLRPPLDCRFRWSLLPMIDGLHHSDVNWRHPKVQPDDDCWHSVWWKLQLLCIQKLASSFKRTTP